MEFRRITPEDVDAVTEIAIRGMRPSLYPLNLSRDKVRALVRHFAEGGGWNLCAFEGGKPVAVCGVLTQELPFFERREAVAVALYSERTGAGWKLIREMFRWYMADPMLRVLRWPLEWDAEPRMMRIAERAGFNSFNVTASHYKV